MLYPRFFRYLVDNEIHATWATVGMLFNKNWEDWERNIPQTTPNYVNENLSAYKYGKSINYEVNDVIFFCSGIN